MAAKAKKPAAKKAVSKKTVAKKVVAKKAIAKKVTAKKTVAKKVATKAAPKKRFSKTVENALDAVAAAPNASAGNDTEQRHGAVTGGVEGWRIVQFLVDNMSVFGLANDQRIYRWNPRTAVWHLHKEGV